MGSKTNIPVIVQKIQRKQNDEGVWHKHRRGQFFLLNQGVIVLQTRAGRQVLLPQKAGWIPPNVMHQATSMGAVNVVSFYFDLAMGDILPKQVCVFKPSQLLREMVVRISQWKMADIWSAEKLRLIQVMKDELLGIRADTLHLPMPVHNSLLILAQHFIADPSQQINLDIFSKKACMSRRTFTRHFREQTGVPFAKWCQQVRVMHAIEGLAKGSAVSTLAMNLGYNSVSAFIKVFKQYVGQTPLLYQKQLALPH